jgi:ribosomal protein S18 acetylase RimI-like enzyme
MSRPDTPSVLERLERFYDAVPRSGARAEAVGPFSLFVSTGEFPLYGRPRLGLTTAIEPDDVAGLLARQRELGLPEAIEWVVETTPSLTGAALAAGLKVIEFPLLILDRAVSVPTPPDVRVRRVPADEPDLERILAVAAIAFDHGGTATGSAGPRERDALAATGGRDRSRLRERLAEGSRVLVVAEDRDGPIASGAHQRVGDVTEIVAVATLPSARRRGLGAAVTGALVRDALDWGVRLVFLSAESDDVARIYERLGFRTTALAGVAGPR